MRRYLEKLKDDLSTVYMTAQPMRDDINHLLYKLKAAEKLNEVVHDNYTSCLKNRSIGREFQKLQYTIKLANSKARELEQTLMNEEEEDQITRGRKSEFAERAPI